MSPSNNIPGFDLLRFNHAGTMQLKDSGIINYGVIRLTEIEVVYYTGLGLREMWKPSMTEEERIRAEELKKIMNESDGEQKLIKSGHIAITLLENILRVIF